MDDARRLHIDLDLRVHGDEVDGSASTAGAPARDFSGWVGLLAALDALTATGPDPAPEPG
jgi:hypothetical protein